MSTNVAAAVHGSRHAPGGADSLAGIFQTILSGTVDTATTGALVANTVHRINVSGGSISRALPTTAAAGAVIYLEKDPADTSLAWLTATGTINGTSSSSIHIYAGGDSAIFVSDGAGGWLLVKPPVYNQNGSLSMRGPIAGGSNASALQGTVFSNGEAMSVKSPGPNAVTGAYAFIYPDGGRGLWMEAPVGGFPNDGGYVFLRPGGDNLTAGGLQNGVLIMQPGVTGYGNRSGAMLIWDASGNKGTCIASGTGVPAIGGEVGDLYIRIDTPATAGQRFYWCTTAGAVGSAVWTPEGVEAPSWAPRTRVLIGQSPDFVYNSATYAGTGNTAFLMNGAEYNASGAQNDGLGFRDFLYTGCTYDLTVAFGKGPIVGIITTDISYDGGSTWSTLDSSRDLYNATYTNITVAVTGIAPPTTGKVILRFRALSKNASSTGYFMYLSAYTFRRTA